MVGAGRAVVVLVRCVGGGERERGAAEAWSAGHAPSHRLPQACTAGLYRRTMCRVQQSFPSSPPWPSPRRAARSLPPTCWAPSTHARTHARTVRSRTHLHRCDVQRRAAARAGQQLVALPSGAALQHVGAALEQRPRSGRLVHGAAVVQRCEAADSLTVNVPAGGTGAMRRGTGWGREGEGGTGHNRATKLHSIACTVGGKPMAPLEAAHATTSCSMSCPAPRRTTAHARNNRRLVLPHRTEVCC